MAFIELNGLDLPAVQDQGDRDDMELGEGMARAFDGSVLRSNRGFKRQWSFTTL